MIGFIFGMIAMLGLGVLLLCVVTLLGCAVWDVPVGVWLDKTAFIAGCGGLVGIIGARLADS